MAPHRSSQLSGGVVDERSAHIDEAASPATNASEITDIIPFNEFGDLADLDFRDNSAFDRESQVIHAPELDDLHDTDDLIPLRLAVPSEFRRDAADERRASHAYRDSHTDVSDGVAGHRHHRHRRPPRPAPQARGARQGPADGRRDGRRRHRRGRVLDGQRLRPQEARRGRAGRRPVRDRRRGRSPARRTACRSSPSRPRPIRPCTPRRSPRPPRSRRSAPSAKRA